MKVEYEESAREVRGIMDLLSPPDMRHMELEQAQEISVCSYRPALLFLSVPVCAIPERACSGCSYPDPTPPGGGGAGL